MAGITAIVTTIDSFRRPTLLRLRHSTVTRCVKPQIDLVLNLRHMGATCRLVVDFVVAVRLLIFVDNVLMHNFRQT